jgi:hypothetical protein
MKEVKDLFNENYKSLKKEIKEDLRIWKDLPSSCIGRISIVKMATLPKVNYMSNLILIRIPMTFFMLHLEAQKTSYTQSQSRIAILEV